MSTKISIADSAEWEAFRRMWDGPEVLHIRASMRVGDGGEEADGSPERDVEVILPTRWILEIGAALYDQMRHEQAFVKGEKP